MLLMLCLQSDEMIWFPNGQMASRMLCGISSFGQTILATCGAMEQKIGMIVGGRVIGTVVVVVDLVVVVLGQQLQNVLEA